MQRAHDSDRPQLSVAASQGNRRLALEALRDYLAGELESTGSAISIAPMARELRAVIEELDSLPLDKEESAVDDLTAKRADRRKKAAGL